MAIGDCWKRRTEPSPDGSTMVMALGSMSIVSCVTVPSSVLTPMRIGSSGDGVDRLYRRRCMITVSFVMGILAGPCGGLSLLASSFLYWQAFGRN